MAETNARQEGSGILRKIKDFWIENPQIEQPTTVKSQKQTESSRVAGVVSGVPSHQNGGGTTSPPIDLGADPEAVKLVEERIFGVKEHETPYELFAATYKKLEAVPMDESTRYKAALTTSGRSIDEILQGLDNHLERIAQQRSVIENEFSTEEVTRVTVRLKELESLETDRVSTLEQISELQAKLAEIGAKKSMLEQVIASEQQKIDSAKARLFTAADTVKTRLSAERRKLEVYGKEVVS